jgi:tripartite-type tricarboxylate transporter receptor subunit TctC
MRRIGILILAVALLPFIAVSALAQNYPDRTVAVIVPFPPGGSVDGVARIVVDKLNQTVGPRFIVENRAGGASGNVGAEVVAKAAPDGYALLLFDLVRKDPQKYTFGTTSIGSAGHLVIELLKREAAVDTLVVAYKGTAPALTDLMSGQIQLLADPMLSSLPLAQAGRIKALAITSLKRQAAAPEIPTVEESGLPGFEFESWYGLWGPKNLPADIAAKLQASIANAMAQPDVKARLNTLGFEAIGSTADKFAKFIESEMAKYEKIIHDANIKAE